jgi:hypothetical protein
VKKLRTLLFTLSVLGGLSGLAAPLSGAAVYHSDGSVAKVKALHNAASDGDTITLPAGTFTWSTPVTISKAIKIQGEGSGRIIGTTKSSVAVGTGSKTFTTTRSGLPITAGQLLRIAKMPHPPGGGGSEANPPGRGTYMEGTVTSYSGTTLVLNVTSTAGSGTWTFWWIATQSATTIVNNYSNAGKPSVSLVQINQSRAGSTEISGIRFLANPATTNRSGFIGLSTSAYLNPKTKIHDCWFQNDGGGAAAIYAATNQGLVWNCSFDDTFSQASAALTFKWEDSSGASSWTTNSTMGADDINGATNFYVEDCDFHAYLVAADPDSSARMVFRHNVFDNSGLSSHGADTGPIGMRHVELYDNELIFDNFGDCDGSVTLPIASFFWQRGGTSVITDNILPAISSCAWGNKGNILFSVLNTRRKTGGYPCWTSYPAPHQVGQGYGPRAVFHSHYSGTNYGRLDYHTYLEPVYIWGNRGTSGNRVGLNAESEDPCGKNQLLTSYIQADRDYKLEPKPGYVKFTYPHPLRSSISASQPRPSAGASPLPESAFDPGSPNVTKAKSSSRRWPGKYHKKEKTGWGSLRKKEKQTGESSESDMAGGHETPDEQNR